VYYSQMKEQSMKRRLNLWMALGLVLMLLLAACGNGDTDDTELDGVDDASPADTEDDADDADDADAEDADEPAAAGEELTLRFSTASVPDDHHTQAIYRFAEEVAERTDGRVEIEVHDSGSLYDQTTEQTALLRGDLDMAYASPQWVAEQVPAASITGVPYMIDDVDHLYAVMDGDVGQELFDLVVDEAGIRPLTSLYLGTRQLNLRDIGREVQTPEDLNGVALRVPDAEAWIKMGQALGANPTPVAFGELYLALETGTVDGQDNPLPTTRSAGFFEVTDQIVLTGHLVNDVWPTINEDVWQGLDAETQAVIEESWLVARDFATEIALEAEAELVEFFEAEGLTVYEPDRDAFRDHVLGEYLDDEAVTSQWIDGMYEQIRDLAS
jgi:TRAP-type transport system periplasmic protein